MQNVLKDLDTRMKAALEAMGREFASIRTGRASANLLDSVRVDYYGNPTPVNQMASVSVPDARTIMIQPWEIAQLKAIEKAIQIADLGVNPQNDGKVIRLVMPTLTEERRKQLAKSVGKVAEEGRVAIRNIRRDVMHDLRELRDAGEAGSDDEHRAEEALQKLTDEKVHELDALLKGKEEEILEV